MEWLPRQEYGIRVSGVEYHVPITASALIGLITGPAFELLRCDQSWRLPVIENPSYVYLGRKDPLQLDGAELMASTLRERLRSPRIQIFAAGDHQLRGVTSEAIESICPWLATDLRWVSAA
jgi:hypothetical protein